MRCSIDDIEDDAQLRRGVPGELLFVLAPYAYLYRYPASHKIYGVPQTINSANYVYFLAYQELFSLRSGIGMPNPTDGQKDRLIPFNELDRIVTGMQ